MNLHLQPRLPGDTAFFAIAAISTAALIVLRTCSVDEVTRWWIPGFEVVLLLRAALPTRPWSALRTHLAIALGLCLAGDVLINWTSWEIYSIAFFALVHINLLWIFASLRRPRLAELPHILPWCAASAAVFASIASDLPKPWMAPVLGAYLLLLDLMAWRAVSLLRAPRPAGSTLFAVGAVLFFATDHLVVLQILRPATVWVVATWICYPPALSLLALASRYLAGTIPDDPG